MGFKMRKIIKASTNEDELKEFDFLKLRLAEPDTSKAIKLTVRLLHLFLDKLNKDVPQPLLEVYFKRIKYMDGPRTISFEKWKVEEELQKKGIL